MQKQQEAVVATKKAIAEAQTNKAGPSSPEAAAAGGVGGEREQREEENEEIWITCLPRCARAMRSGGIPPISPTPLSLVPLRTLLAWRKLPSRIVHCLFCIFVILHI
jgi:hypothetical protein